MPHTNPISPADAGCWVDGHHGHYASLRLIHIAQGYEMELSPADAAIVDAYENESHLPEYPIDEFVGVADDAEEFLQKLAPEGYSFEWVDGEFFLSVDEEEE